MPGTKNPSLQNGGDVFDIAAVCRLTGLTAANLRMWEKRHQAVNPGRTETGRRQYTRRDLQRLSLLKALSDEGHSIRTIVGLPLAELEKRLQESVKARSVPDLEKNSGFEDRARSCRIVVIGVHLSALLESEDALPAGAATICEYADLTEAENAEVSDRADLLLVEVPALFAEDLIRTQRLVIRFQALRAIVVYAYAQALTVDEIAAKGGAITAIRAPITLSELRDACATEITLANRSAISLIDGAPGPRDFGEEIPKRHFSQRQLARVSQVSSTVECECPHHLSALLEALNGFEDYSAQCESRNAADAKVHAYLHKMTSHARATVEEALKVLIEFEDIDVGDA